LTAFLGVGVVRYAATKARTKKIATKATKNAGLKKYSEFIIISINVI